MRYSVICKNSSISLVKKSCQSDHYGPSCDQLKFHEWSAPPVMVASTLLVKKIVKNFNFGILSETKIRHVLFFNFARYSRHALFAAGACFEFDLAKMAENGFAPEPYRAHACTTKN